MNADALMNTYNRLPVSFTHGKGAWLWDDEGTRYLDALSGIAVCGLGHNYPAVTQAVQAQAEQLLHCSNLYRIPQQTRLGAMLVERTGMEKVFFCNSGAEANEAAIKISRLFARKKGIHRPKVVTMAGSFHGRTLGALSATGNQACQQGFEPLLEGFIQVPYNDLQALAQNPQARKDIVAILVEPIQGEGGVNIPSKGYLKALRVLCDENDWLLMLDEIQTGMCRTGHWLACQHEGVLPDVVTLAKALGNGVPIGACLAGKKTAELLQPGMHGTTFGGNPLACAAAIATLQSLDALNSCQQAKTMGGFLLERLRATLSDCPHVIEVRGQGLMIGIELDRPCALLVPQALQKGLLINVTAGKVVRLLPPLIIEQHEAEQLVSGLTDLIAHFPEMEEAEKTKG